MNYSKIKVAHIITRMIIGGAQENTLSTVTGLQNDEKYSVDLIIGPETGPEGRLSLENVKKIIIENSLVRNINPLKDIICILKLRQIIKKNKYDIVHTHSSKAGIIGRMAARLAGVPVIIHTIHGLPFHSYQNKILNFIYVLLERFCAGFTDKIIVVANQMKVKSMQKKIGDDDKYVTIFSGMDLDSFLDSSNEREKTRQELNIPKNKIVIGKIARLFPLKGHEYILRIAPLIIKENPDVLFLWIGDGLLKESLIKKIEQMGLMKNFILTGLVEPFEIKKYLSVMDILVHTSLREGLPRIIPQGFAAKVPVVCFDVDGAKDLIIDGENGFLVAPEDCDQLKNKIMQLVNNIELREDFVNEAIKAVNPFFREEYMVGEIKKVYERALK